MFTFGTQFIVLSLVLGVVTLSEVSAQVTPNSMEKTRGVVLAEKFQKTCEGFLKKKKDSKNLDLMMESLWDFTMQKSPEWATYVGYEGLNDQWSDSSLAAIDASLKVSQCYLKVAEQFEKVKLSHEQKLNVELLKDRLSTSIKDGEFRSYRIPLNQMDGIHLDVPDVLEAAPKKSVKDYEDRLLRLERLPTVLAQIQTLMEQGMKDQVTLPRFLMERVPGQMDGVLSLDVSKNTLYSSFQKFSGDIPEADQKRLQAKADELLKKSVVPAFQNFKKFLLEEYIPACRTEIAWSTLPNGQAWYQYQAEYHTTTKLTPQEVHEIGKKEVARILLGMNEVIRGLGFKGTRQEFNQFLAKDDQFYFKDARELIREYRDIAKRIDGELGTLFRKLPRTQYGVKAMSADKAPLAPTAYYRSGSLATGRAGFFEANTYDLRSRPKYEMEALTAHEAMPGHHLQIALAQELENLPKFRRHGGYTAFIEGWGLYAESLGAELGLYQDPYSRYGQLTYEMWRAVRLVVDTGMHSMGWSREQALKYFMDHIPKSELQSANEIDRYIVMPGQALAYKIGQLKFQELRENSKLELKESFDVREFHDEVLKNGALPLHVLERQVQSWVELKKKNSQSKKL